MAIAYDGTRYNGWQIQGNTENTIQGVLQGAIAAVCGAEVELIGSGRTDAGVHAYKQVANFKTDCGMDVERMREQINGGLHKDIRVLEAVEADTRFHARYNATGKVYVYRIWNKRDVNVFERKYAYHRAEPLDMGLMRAAAARFVGTHDFRGFSADKRTKKSTVKTMHSVTVTGNGGMIEITFHGDAFLYNMARIMAGTIIETGLGKSPVNKIDYTFEKKSAAAVFTAPPHGLFLKDVLYDLL